MEQNTLLLVPPETDSARIVIHPEPETCLICYQPLQKEQVQDLGCCGKKVHASCLSTWLATDIYQRCPHCNVIFTSPRGPVFPHNGMMNFTNVPISGELRMRGRQETVQAWQKCRYCLCCLAMLLCCATPAISVVVARSL